MGFEKKDISENIIVLKSLKGYSERMGLFADNGCDEICKKSECPEKVCRLHYENSLKTAIDVMEHYLTLSD